MLFRRETLFRSLLIFPVLTVIGCASAEEPAQTASGGRTLTGAPLTAQAPDQASIQDSINKAQQAESLLDLYADRKASPDIVDADASVPENLPELPTEALNEAQRLEQASMPKAPREEITQVDVNAPKAAPAQAQDKALEQVIAEQTQENTIPVAQTDAQQGSQTPNTPEARQNVAAIQDDVRNYQPASGSPQRYIANDKSPILNAGETVKVTVFNDADLSGEYEINTQGFITMPLIGDLRAAGLSQNTLQMAISDNLSSRGYLVDPIISVEIVALRPFYILGEVRNPGNYDTVPEMDVFKALAIAGGLTPRAVDDEFIIYRGFGANRQQIEAREDTPVLPGDSIKVKERFF